MISFYIGEGKEKKRLPTPLVCDAVGVGMRANG
jgi:hypothetical protein